MNFKLDYTGFEDCLYKVEEMDLPCLGGTHHRVQYVFKFDNGYGASVIKDLGSRGHEQDLWDLGVLKTYEDVAGELCWVLCYDTPITDDVEGYLTDTDVRVLMDKIQKLPKSR